MEAHLAPVCNLFLCHSYEMVGFSSTGRGMPFLFNLFSPCTGYRRPPARLSDGVQHSPQASPLFQPLLPWPVLPSSEQLCAGVAESQPWATCPVGPVPGLLSWVSYSSALTLAQPEVWKVNTDGQVLTNRMGAEASHFLPAGARS